VHLYGIAADVAGLTELELQGALVALGEDFALDPRTAWSARSADGRVIAAGVHHAAELCASRRYTSISSTRATWFDGLPVHADGALEAHDAGALAANWDSLERTLEGQFSAVHFDLAAARVEVQTDTLGMSQVFWAPRGEGGLISNSATLIATLLGLDEPDPLGASTFLGLGWPVGTHTTTRELGVLPGGARHVLNGTGLQSRRSFGPGELIEQAQRRPEPAARLAADLTRQMAGVVRGVGPVYCALTAGKDTRVVTALLHATGQDDVLYYTNGGEDVEDVIVARELASRFGLRHEVYRPDPASATIDWTRAAALFMRQNDGLVSLHQLPDYVDLDGPPQPLGVKLWGMGGEIGRAGTGALMATGTTVPLVRRSGRLQHKLLALKVRNAARLMSDEALAQVDGYLRDYQRERLQEGWPEQQVQDAFYTFERIGRWGATGPRRAAGRDDIFTPFCSRSFIDYCFSLSAGERYLEAAHYRLLSELSPTLRDHRLSVPFQAQQPWLAPVLATGRLLRALRELAMRRMHARSGTSLAAQPIAPEYPFPHVWLEQRLGLVREMFASHPSSQLWSFMSRTRVEELLGGEESQRARHQEELLRAITLFWHFHGPRP
jgi:hypothetical protein